MPDGARNLRARLFVAGWLFAASSAFAANLSPAEQLQHMAQSLRSLDYQGSFLYQNSGRLDTLRIFHSGGGSSGERERLISLSGSRSEAVRHGELITASKQGETAVSFSGGASARLLPLIPTDPDKLPNASYGLREGNSERVAGYESQVVDIVPVDRFRYGYRLWLERSNQLPLRVALLADDQRIVEQYMFVMLSVGTAPAETELSLSDVAGKPVPARANVALKGPPRWSVSDLPVGYELTGRHATAHADGKSEQLVFSDGLANVSAYVEPTPDPINDDVALNRGAMNVYIHRNGSWRYTVLGNVPAVTVQRIALSLRPVDNSDAPN